MKLYDNAPEIVFCDNHVLVANKPAGLLTQPDETGNSSCEVYLKEWIKREYNKPGNVYLHAIHRLDKPVSGLLIFARTSKALSRFNEMSRNMAIQRIYTAETEGILPKQEGKLDHFLIHRDHKAVVGKEGEEGAKHARLTFEVIRFKEHSTLVRIELETGRYHQIRAQFSAIGHPILGDLRYGSKKGNGSSIHLHCSELSFSHPVTKEMETFCCPAPFG